MLLALDQSLLPVLTFSASEIIEPLITAITEIALHIGKHVAEARK